jgi:hypothetical protein
MVQHIKAQRIRLLEHTGRIPEHRQADRGRRRKKEKRKTEEEMAGGSDRMLGIADRTDQN